MSISFSRRRKETPDINKEKLRSFGIEFSKRGRNEYFTYLKTRIANFKVDKKFISSYTLTTSRGIRFASRDLDNMIYENIQILITYSNYLKTAYNIQTNNLEAFLAIVESEYRAQQNSIINGFLTRIEEELELYSYIPIYILESIVLYYLFIYFYKYLEESGEKNCDEIIEILKFLTEKSKEKFIEKKGDLITNEQIKELYEQGTTEIKGILLDFSYSIYTQIIFIKTLFTKLCLMKIVEICSLKEKKPKSLLNRFIGRIREKVVPISRGGGKMNILIINLYSKPEKFDKKGKVFKEIFKNKAKLIVKNWEDKEGIIEIIKSKKINGIILSGSDFRIKEMNKGIIPEEVFKSNIPILGLCYGFQYLVYYYSSLKNIKTFSTNKYKTYDKSFKIEKPFKIRKTKYRFHHHDYISKLPKNWKIGVEYKKIIFMGFYNKHIGIQFHPEIHKQSAKLFYSMWLKFIHKYTS